MVEVEGYKAFKGTLRVTPKSPEIEAFELEGDWLYKPSTNCWYGKGEFLICNFKVEVLNCNKSVWICLVNML